MKSSHVRLAAWIAAIAVSAGAIALRAQPSDSGGLRASIALQDFVHVHSEMPLPMIAMQGTTTGRAGHVPAWSGLRATRGESAHDVVTVFSDATIEGTMLGDLVVVFGTVRVGPNREHQRFADCGRRERRDSAWRGCQARPGRHRRRTRRSAELRSRRRALRDWREGHRRSAAHHRSVADRRPAPRPADRAATCRGCGPSSASRSSPRLPLALLFLGSVRTCADAVAARPFTTFLVGLLVLLLTGPVSLPILAASVIGIAVVPFVLCAVVVAWIIGKIGLTVRLGDSMVGQTLPATRLQTVRSLTLGFAAICLLYMIPIVGLITWALVGVSGLGAATIAFMSAYRRENPTPPKARKPAPTPPPDTPIVPRPRSGPGDARSQRYPALRAVSG